MCYFLHDVKTVKEGQIAHLDQDNANPDPDNLAFLCLECHNNYDRKSNRVQGYTAAEVRVYRDRLHRVIGPAQVEWNIRIRASSENYDTLRPLVYAAHAELRKSIPDVYISEGSGN